MKIYDFDMLIVCVENRIRIFYILILIFLKLFYEIKNWFFGSYYRNVCENELIFYSFFVVWEIYIVIYILIVMCYDLCYLYVKLEWESMFL